MKWIAVIPIILLILAGNASALSVDLGIDEVLIVDNSTVSFDVAQNNPGLVFLMVETPNGSVLKGLTFGESLYTGGVNYTVGRLDPTRMVLTLHLSGNYSKTEVLKKRDFKVEVLEAFDAYVKLRVTNTGYYDLNDTLLVSSQGVPLEERSIFLRRGESTTLKVRAPSGGITVTAEGSGISRTVTVGSFEELVSVDEIRKDEGLHVRLRNHGDATNVTIKLLLNGLTVEKMTITMGRGEEKEVSFESDINQGALLIEYGGVTRQESFYFEAPTISLTKVERVGDKLGVWLKNEGKGKFAGKVSVYQNGFIVGEPYYRSVEVNPDEEALVEFRIPRDAEFLTIAVSSGTYSLTFPIQLKGTLDVRALNSYSKGILGGTASYTLLISGDGDVTLGVEGLPDSIGASFYYNGAEVKELNVVKSAQVTLLLRLPNLPRGFTLNVPLTFNVTVNGIKTPLKLEVGGIGILPVYGDNWLAKMNYTSEHHHVGLPYRVVGRDLTPPFVFEPSEGEKIAVLYGDYVGRGKDLSLHLLDTSGRIVASSTQEKGKSDYLVFNQSDFMLMVEGSGYFNSILLVADYLERPMNITFELRRKEFGEGLRTFVINASPLRGKTLKILVNSSGDVEVRAYHFTLNREKEDFDPLSASFKGAFRGSGRKIEGEIGVRSYEDFVAVAVIGEGNVTMKFNVVGGELGVGEVSSKAAYLAVLGLLLLLLAAVWLERRIG
ncbi:COG1470 family protein [Thermococcus celer]|uniref:Uncharacterized protein n=1 Tax=Thermococcus celer Vu 13 = JCM 8558 TaxID=1293037 RepID=A0A218P3Y9_THECE|nr:hypothetical protein [Thermococcus celer]ASI99623.1 hypothetical protein A3L02_08665 [Thermococcus celer Vu 13 = JCM 8558]